jgi:hypothetical protein
MPPDSLRILLGGLVDYAGLFPPASLSMREVAANYASYRCSADAWVLGRLIVPVAQLEGLAESIVPSELPNRDGWRISAIVTADIQRDAEHIAQWNGSMKGALIVDTVELRAATAADIERAADVFHDTLHVYVEIPHAADPAHLLDTIARAGVRAKIRTGGVTPDAFPTAAQVVRFLRRCIEHGVAFKATAGLHHPLRDTYRLTYASDAPRGEMFGFLNVFLAAAFAHEGLRDNQLVQLMKERDPASLQFTRDCVRWHQEEVDTQRLADIRTSFAATFGSCSFREPIDDLHQLGLL